MRRHEQFSDSQKVYQMCTPHPKPLLQGRRSLVRHGTLDYFSPNTISRKPRYFFLFSDCLLLTKRTGTQKFWLKVYIHLGPNIHIIPMWDSPDFEFRLLIDEKGTLAKRKQRRLILYGQNKSHKEAWLSDLLHCLWDSTGRKGPDPSIRDDKKEVKSPRGKKEDNTGKWSCSNCTYLNKPDASHCDMCGGAKFGGDVEEYDSSDDEEKRRRREKKDRQNKQGGGQGDNFADTSNPLLLFDPFSDNKGPEASFDPSQHRGVDQFGQAVPKGVMLEGDNPYGSSNPYGAGAGYPSGGAPYGSGAGGPFDPSQGAYGGAATAGAYGSGASPYGMGVETAGLAGGAYAGGVSPYAYGGVAAGSPYGTDPSGLYDAARNASAALGGMFATAPGSGGAAGAGLAGAGLGGAGGFGAGVATTSPPLSGGSAGSPATSQREDNLDDLAQKELLEATRVIEQLAAQLASRPRKAPPRTAETEHLEITTEEISDAIMDGAQAIARAASALMRAAALAQEERVKLNTHRSASDGSPYHADPVWANGLISAARNVVATTQYLVTTSNAAANGQAGEETLVASARAVGAATAHLVAAQKAKGDVNSQASRELDDAARGIARATASLVEAAKLASTPAPAPAPTSAVPDKYTMTDKQIREIEAQTKLLQLEKETQRAREELLKMRKQEYSG